MNSTYLTNTILKILAKDHAKLTAKGRARHRIDRLFTEVTTELPETPLSVVLPSRSEFHEFRPRYKRGMTPQDAQQMALIHCCKTRLAQPSPRPAWTRHLKALIAGIRSRTTRLDPFSYTSLEVQGMPKNGDIFRPVVNFGFHDGIIERCVARFASRRMDRGLLPCAVAYRQLHGQQHPIVDLHQFRGRHPHKKLWCAEADIQNFCDTLDHSVARNAFLRHLDRIPARFQLRVLILVDALLDAYSFPEQALAIGLPALQLRHPQATFPWPVAALTELHGCDPRGLRIGVPQGAALSCLLANLVLDAADRAVMEVARGWESEIFYRRYCDDMILVSPDRGLCEAAFDAYLQILHALKIPVHPPATANDFGREFAKLKSKAVYPWGADPHRHASWVSFIGYQIRHDGLVRIRPATVKKHMNKMEQELHDLHRLIKLGHVPRASKPRIFSSYAHRIIAMSTGNPDTEENASRCWCNCFAELRNLPFDRLQIVELDQFRNALIGRLRGMVLHLPESSATLTRTAHRSMRAFSEILREIRGYSNSYMRSFESPTPPDQSKSPKGPHRVHPAAHWTAVREFRTNPSIRNFPSSQ